MRGLQAHKLDAVLLVCVLDRGAVQGLPDRGRDPRDLAPGLDQLVREEPVGGGRA